MFVIRSCNSDPLSHRNRARVETKTIGKAYGGKKQGFVVEIRNLDTNAASLVYHTFLYSNASFFGDSEELLGVPTNPYQGQFVL